MSGEKSNVVQFKDGETIETGLGYQLLYANTPEELEEMVESNLDLGWSLVSGAFVGAGGEGYCQTMVFFEG